MIDIGVIVVSSDKMQTFLTDRTPSLKDAIRYIETEFPEAINYPIVLMAVEHDGPTLEALPKKKTNRGKKKNLKASIEIRIDHHFLQVLTPRAPHSFSQKAQWAGEQSTHLPLFTLTRPSGSWP